MAKMLHLPFQRRHLTPHLVRQAVNQQHHKLIAADPVYLPPRKRLADSRRRVADVLVAHIVAEPVVGLL